MKTLICAVFFHICIVQVSLGYVWEDRNAIKPVYVWNKPKVLRAEHGISHKSNVPDDFRPGFQVFPINNDDKTPKSYHIPPSFITGARLEADNSRYTERILTKPKRWAISKIYQPPIEVGHENGPESIYSVDHDYEDFEDEHLSIGFSDFDRINPDVELTSEDFENADNRPDVTDLNYVQATKPTYEEPFLSQGRPTDHVNPSFRQEYVPPNTDLHDIDQYIIEPFRPIVEEPKNAEPIHQIRRSPTIWPTRDISKSGAPRHTPCTLSLHRGMGPDSLSSWYYDSSENQCRWFGYRGHGGNANRFYSRSACEAHCIRDLTNMCDVVSCSWPGTACKLVEDRACKDNEHRYNRDWRLKCPPDQPVCMSRRGTKMAPDLEFKQIPLKCMQPKNSGSCERKNPALNFYYDPIQHTCLTFYFHNCGGNDNRFETKSDCMTYCAP